MASENLPEIIQKKIGIFPALLIYAFLECVLIILLFLDGLISFAASEFAFFFGLKAPCLLCTRIDHVLAHRDADFYYKDSICDTHGKDISALRYCNIHMGLSDVRQMCTDCLLSVAMEKKSSLEIYRSLVAILGAKLEISVEDDSKIHLKLPISKEEYQSVVKKRNVRCSCCSGPKIWISADVCQVPEIPVPSSVPPDRESSMVMGNEESRPMSHISFMERRITSDCELDNANNDNISGVVISENHIYTDEIMGIRKSSESVDGSISEASVSMLSLRDNGKEATVGADEIVNQSEILINDAYKIAMANKLNITSKLEPNDASKASSTPNPAELPIFHKRLSIPILRKRLSIRREKSMDSLMESNANRVRWKSLLHRLKRRVHLDRKSLIKLSTELDEERSAAAIAANQAMAMITRLQEQKASVQMEASHYQRLMEEQVEYDQEALQIMRDLLIKREMKIKALEAEVTYRERFQYEVER